ncbi:PLDc N-terminal domain-containing protein [bacterium]|nr:PLDc N-terminal domain-containing protein [bacterium]
MLLLENRNPVKSLSWVLVLLFLPVIGKLSLAKLIALLLVTLPTIRMN